MKLSASIELVMQFATYEAIAGQFQEIEPEHLLMALLKFPELPVEEMEKLVPGAGTKEIMKEIDVVHKEIACRLIDSKKVRHELRAKIGRGNSPFGGGRIHRSAAGRQIFDVAGKLADDAGSETITAGHILEALMIAPTRLIEQVLGDAVGAKVQERKNTPLLDEYGRDLIKMATDGDSDRGNSQIIEGRALLNVLSHPARKSVLLITDSEPIAMRTVTKAAQIIAVKDNCPSAMRAKRIIDVTGLRQTGPSGKKMTEQFAKLYSEAASAQDMILLVPSMDSTHGLDSADEWASFLLKTITNGSVQCICRIAPMIYQNRIKKEFTWKRIASVIWLCEEVKDEIPREL